MCLHFQYWMEQEGMYLKDTTQEKAKVLFLPFVYVFFTHLFSSLHFQLSSGLAYISFTLHIPVSFSAHW